jgi:UDP-N-acetylmuramate--alanine ligase
VPFYGAALLCLDHPEVQAIIPRVRDRRIVTYGFAASADVRGVNVTPHGGGNRFEAIIRQRDGSVRSIEGIELPMPGRHNVQNALAAVGVALELGIDDATIQRGFSRFEGVKRRFTKVGEVGGVTIIDDYGHHPVEIRAVLAAARESAEGRVIAVMQPHRFSRLGNLMDDFAQAFNDADMVFVSPVYAAGEAPVEGVDSEALVEGVKRRGHRSAATVADAGALAAALAETVQPGDMVVCLGAGDITKWAAGLATGIEAAKG